MRKWVILASVLLLALAAQLFVISIMNPAAVKPDQQPDRKSAVKSQSPKDVKDMVVISFDTDEEPNLLGELPSGTPVYSFTKPLKVGSDYVVGYTYNLSTDVFAEVRTNPKLIERGEEISLEQPGLYYLVLFVRKEDGSLDPLPRHKFLVILDKELTPDEIKKSLDLQRA